MPPSPAPTPCWAAPGEGTDTLSGNWRLAGRVEYFATGDEDDTPDDPNGGQGWSMMLASWQPKTWRKLREGMYIASERDVWNGTATQTNDEAEYIMQLAAVAEFWGACVDQLRPQAAPMIAQPIPLWACEVTSEEDQRLKVRLEMLAFQPGEKKLTARIDPATAINQANQPGW